MIPKIILNKEKRKHEKIIIRSRYLNICNNSSTAAVACGSTDEKPSNEAVKLENGEFYSGSFANQATYANVTWAKISQNGTSVNITSLIEFTDFTKSTTGPITLGGLLTAINVFNKTNFAMPYKLTTDVDVVEDLAGRKVKMELFFQADSRGGAIYVDDEFEYVDANNKVVNVKKTDTAILDITQSSHRNALGQFGIRIVRV